MQLAPFSSWLALSLIWADQPLSSERWAADQLRFVAQIKFIHRQSALTPTPKGKATSQAGGWQGAVDVLSHPMLQVVSCERMDIRRAVWPAVGVLRIQLSAMGLLFHTSSCSASTHSRRSPLQQLPPRFLDIWRR